MPSLARHCIGPFALLFGLGSCTMGAPEEDGPDIVELCYEAADNLERCTGEVPGGFVAECTYDPDDQARSAARELAEAECDGLPAGGKADVVEGAFVRGACLPAMSAAYLSTRARSPGGQPLSASQKRALRPIFAGNEHLLDEVRVSWEASLYDSWSVGGYDIVVGSTNAQAFGSEIFIDDPEKPGDPSQLALLAHEITHSWQAERYGGAGPFYEEYCRQFYRADFSYRDIPDEIQARQVQGVARDCVDSGSCR